MPIRFGSFQLDEERFELRRGDTLIELQPRVLETILFLVKRRGRLVTKEELIAGPWRGMRVTDTALSQAIRQARAALGEDPRAPRFIQTIRGKGFRFHGDLIENPRANDAIPRSQRLRPFFGRQHETERLRLTASEARAGHGNVVLLHGPPGVGKTRLAQWFATHQRDAGSEVCWGGCREGQSAPPFWPWPEILQRYTETRETAGIERLVRDLKQDLVAVVPELREVLGEAAASTPNESHERAQSVLDAIATFVRRAAEQAPLTLVLEDLHLADDAALRLLEVIARDIADTQLMVLGTFRRAEGAARALLDAVCEGSLPHLQGLALDGLSLNDVAQWLSATSPTPLTNSIVEALHFSTEGLPLLVEALIDELPTWKASMLTPDSDQHLQSRGRVKEILGRRLHQLDAHTIGLLRTAAVCGEEFPIAVLEAVTGEPLSVLLPRLDQAQQHGILKPATEGSLRFAHALHQELLIQELSAIERRQQHAALAKVFADQLEQKPDTIVETAHHFLEAVPCADLDTTAFYAQKAAEWARSRHAYGRAAEYYRRALEVSDMGTADPRQYAELLLALSHALFVTGAIDDAAATLERTFELTRANSHYDLFCRAILIWFQLRHDAAAIDPVFHARIAEALQNIQAKDTVYAQLQVARAMSTMLTASPRERIGWIQEALTLTRESADPRTRLDVLRGAQRSHIRFTDGTTELGVTEELLQLAVALHSPECESEARQWRANALLELGRGADYEHEVTASRERAMVVRAPQVAWVAGALHVGHLFLAGSLEECERAARDTGKVGQDLMGIGGFLYMTTQLFQVGLEGTEDEAQRILCEVAAGGERVLALAPGFQALMLMVARARMYCGQSDAAEDYLARVTGAHYVQPDPLDRNFLPAMVCAADLACSRNDVAATTVVSSLLGAWKGWHAVAALGSAYLGPVSYWLGRLSLVGNRREDARRQLELARQESQRAGSVIYLAWSNYYLAQALPSSEAALSCSLLESARSAAQRFSLGRLQTVLGA